VAAVQVAGRAFLRVLVAMPGRQLNILRWTRGREFRQVHAVSVAWMDSHFELLERGAPWLNGAGRDVRDFCSGGVRPFFRLEGGHGAAVRCSRRVTAVYGFDGQLVPLLRSLDQALRPAGWNLGTRALPQSWADLDPGRALTAQKLARHRTRWMVDRQVNLTWQPTEGLATRRTVRERHPGAGSCWRQVSGFRGPPRGQATGWHEDPNRQRPATRGYVAVEVSDAGVVRLLEQALDRYEHALTVTVSLRDYSNPNARARSTGYQAPSCQGGSAADGAVSSGRPANE
jgi:hypothetical protein